MMLKEDYSAKFMNLWRTKADKEKNKERSDGRNEF
jgi:hypothetical protein